MSSSNIRVTMGSRDATDLIVTATLSGSVRQCARTLALEMAVPDSDTSSVPRIPCAPGVHVLLEADGKTLFDGWGFGDSGALGAARKGLTCYDRGFYLKRNQTALAVKNQTPEDVTRSLAADFGIECGEIAATGVRLTRNFLPSSGGANSLYNIIQALYTLASRETGDKYYIIFEGTRLCVRRRELAEYTLRLRPGSNLLTASTSSSVANMVNQVLVYDRADKLLTTVSDASLSEAYGIMQAVLTAGDGDDPAELARAELEGNGIDQTVSVTNLGGIDCLAGGTVVIREPASGLDGVFWIDEDYHYWRKGIYTNKLVLNYRKLMTEVTAGSED